MNGRAALRVRDPGKHSKKCCGPNTWKAAKGSARVLINNRPAHREDDETEHCGGKGQLIEGSPNCLVGGPSEGEAPAGEPGTASAGHPVDVVSGAMFTDEALDFFFPGVFSFRWTRSYRSSRASTDCGIGHGWSHNHNWTADVRDAHVTLWGPDGQAHSSNLAPGRSITLRFGRRLAMRSGVLVLDIGDGLGRILRRSPDGMYRLTDLVDRSGNVARLGWDGDRLVRILDSVGRRAFLVDDGNKHTWIAYANGTKEGPTRELVTYELDTRGDLVRVTDSRRRTTVYAYDEEHHLVSETRGDGLRYRFRYATVQGETKCIETWGELAEGDILEQIGWTKEFGDERPRRVKGIFHTVLEYGENRSSKVTDGAGGVHKYEGSPLGVVNKYKDARRFEKAYEYDEAGNLTKVKDGLGNEKSWSFDGEGRPSTRCDATGATTEVRATYDGAEMVDPSGARWGAQVDARGRVIATTDPAGAVARYRLDERGRITSITHADGGVETMDCDEHSNVIRRALPGGNAWSYEYDPFGALLSLTDPEGIKTTLTYDEGYNLVAKEGAAGARTEYRLDALKRRVATKYASGEVITQRYVADVVVETRHPDGSVWRMAYDPLLRLASITNPAGDEQVRVYDGNGNPTAELTFAGIAQMYNYDAANRLSRMTRPDRATATMTRDAAGRLTKCEYSTGALERYEYDTAGRVILAQWSTRGQTTTVEFTRDVTGAVIREEQRADSWRFAVDYTRDAAGRVASRTYSSGWGVTIARDAHGLPERTLVSARGKAEVIEIAYDQRGREISRKRPGARPGAGQTIVTKRDEEGRPVRIAVLVDERPIREREYTWSRQGPLASVKDVQLGTRTYRLDPKGRPVQVSGLGTDEAIAYSAHGTPVSSSGSQMRVGAGGRPLNTRSASLEWDALGRLTARRDRSPEKSWTFEYNEKDQLARAERGDGIRVEYVYDAYGRRVVEICGDVITHFGWDHDSIVEESSDGHPTRRVFADNGYVPLLESLDGTDFRMVASDAAGTPWTYIDSAGGIANIDLSARGEVAGARGNPGRLRFAGQRADSMTGLHYNRYRYYAPDLGVYLSPDPLGLKESVQDIAFVENTTCMVDPLGLGLPTPGDAPNTPIPPSPNPTTAIVTVGPDANGGLGWVHGQEIRANPDALDFRVQNLSDLSPNSLSGVDKVYLNVHGSPGQSLEGSGPVDGQTLGEQLKAAGFKGGPGSNIVLVSCNGGTDPMEVDESKFLISGNAVPLRQLGPSTAQALADSTGARVLAPVANDAAVANATHGQNVGTLRSNLPALPVEQDRVLEGHWSYFGK